MKKFVYWLIFGFIALFSVVTVSPVALATATDWWEGTLKGTTSFNSWDIFSWWWKWIAWASDTKGSGLLNVIKNFINWMLWLLATIALVICLYAGFKMVTSAGDEGKYKEGIEMMKKAGIGLVVIGLAWMIVSVVMWLLSSLTASWTTTSA